MLISCGIAVAQISNEKAIRGVIVGEVFGMLLRAPRRAIWNALSLRFACDRYSNMELEALPQLINSDRPY